MFVLGNITFDSADPRSLADFWSQATGYEVKDSNPFMVRLARSDGARPHLLFIKVPEPKQAKNRVHLDFGTRDLEAEVARLESLGATRRESHHEFGVRWWVMSDPDGNEFCVGQRDEG